MYIFTLKSHIGQADTTPVQSERETERERARARERERRTVEEGGKESFPPRKTLCKLSLSGALGGVTAARSERERDGNATSIPRQSRISHITCTLHTASHR